MVVRGFLTDNGEPLGHLRVNFYQKSEFIWVILFTAMVIALILVVWQVIREYDLIIHRYWRMLTRILSLATTCWWLS
ncbi:hypothetical protein AAULR_09615, partial [Lacticaseibacillus rhamnosus MTCC 5462]